MIREATKEMVNAAWNKGKDLRMTGLPSDFRAVIEAALSAAPAPPATGWQTMETAPRDGTRVLLWSPKWEAAATAQFYGTHWKINGQMGPLVHPPTRWMPLPTAPGDAS